MDPDNFIRLDPDPNETDPDPLGSDPVWILNPGSFVLGYSTNLYSGLRLDQDMYIRLDPDPLGSEPDPEPWLCCWIEVGSGEVY